MNTLHFTSFQTITLEDKRWIDECLVQSNFQGCEYTFANLFIWQKPNHIRICKIDNFFCIKSGIGKDTVYTYPAGRGDILSVIEQLMEDAKSCNIPFRLRAITRDKKEELEQLFPNTFLFENLRDEADYIYKVEKLASLSGKKLHKKRNHIARFRDNPNWVYENITEYNISQCFDMNTAWCKKYSCVEDESLNHELCAVKQAFGNFFELGLQGGLLRQDGEIVAYSMGEPLNKTTFVVHIEKAFPEIQGAYPMINQQFVIHNCMDFEYVNREEDVGDEGLRQAKLSYYPDILLEKYSATLL